MFRPFSLVTLYLDVYPKEVVRCSENAGMFIAVTYTRKKIGIKKTFSHREPVKLWFQNHASIRNNVLIE